jgi:anti-sigma factor RsiW
MTDHWIERLSEYLDDELSGAERREADEHLASCAECSRTLQQLRRVVAEARRLEDRPPETDLWPGIAARLRPRGAARVPSFIERLGHAPRRVELSLPQLAAAAFLLMLVSGGAVWLTLRGGPARLRTPLASRSSTVPTVSRGPAAAAFASFDEARYEAAVADLERALREHGSELDTTTVRILQQNLAIIDRAIGQARGALQADPANPYLNGHLAEQLKRKIRLLQRATGVVTAHG